MSITRESIAYGRRQASNAAATSAAQAVSSLSLLLREDQLLTQWDMHSSETKEAPFAYAAALLEEDYTDDSLLAGTTTSTTTNSSSYKHKQRAEDALAEVDRKLALVESLAERVSRTSPEEVAGPLLRLHGYTIEEVEEGDEHKDDSSMTMPTSSSSSSTLMATRERCERLKRQGEVLESIATRVESSLTRGLHRMETATNRLSRVLTLSATLKMILRLQFEFSKLEGFYLDDLRDLTRAAASVAVIEDLLSKPELKEGAAIDIVESIRPKSWREAAAVRKAAAALLKKHQDLHHANSSSAVIQLGATLQVYYHLGELPQAAWNAVDHALAAAEKVCNEFWSPTTLNHLTETSTQEAKIATGQGKKMSDVNVQRTFKKKMKEMRADASAKWATGITDASMQVWNLHQVLSRKSDPVSRQLFVDVVHAAPIPEKYQHPLLVEGSSFSVFALYWERLCFKMGERLKHILEYENGKFSADVSALYPAVRAAAINLLASIHDTMQAGIGAVSVEDATANSSNGLLGGSTALDDSFLKWTTMSEKSSMVGSTLTSAEVWTTENTRGNSSGDHYGSASKTSMTVVMGLPEWATLQGSHASKKGLFRLQMSFLDASSARLCAPLQYMFQENVTVDDMGNAISHLPLLPSRFDIQKVDTNIRSELSLADPREGGGDLSAVNMIADNVIGMVSKFCEQARGAASQVGVDGILNPGDGSPSEALKHDVKVAKILSALADSLRTAPDQVFLEPYRPAVTNKLEEAAAMCEHALQPALQEIDRFVQTLVLDPLSKALNKRISGILARMHHGSYLQTSSAGMDSLSFVQSYLSPLYDRLSQGMLTKLPPKYGGMVASTVTAFSVYAFVSNAALIRPLDEATRLHVTQDLADFELALDQFLVNSGQSVPLNEIANGKPYAELRAMRSMLFWTGLEDQTKTPAVVSKALLREVWVRDVRPSTTIHYLFSFAPQLLSSPHHFKRVRADEYVSSMVSLTGETEEGEGSAWMTTTACCDSYQQRESAQSGTSEGDPRIAAILMALGPELLRRRRP